MELSPSILNRRNKTRLILSILESVDKRRKKHYKAFKKKKRMNTAIKASINILNTVSVSSIVITLSVNPIALIIGLTTSSLGALMTAGLSVVNLQDKILSHQTSYLQYSDILRDYRIKLQSTHSVSGGERNLTLLLNELNTRLGLIEDTELPISISED